MKKRIGRGIRRATEYLEGKKLLIYQRCILEKSETSRETPQVQMQTGGQPDMPLVLLFLCVAGGVWGSAPGAWGYGRIQDRQGTAATMCPSPCHCEEDGIFIMVDCSEMGLSSVPANLSPLTTYLWVTHHCWNNKGLSGCFIKFFTLCFLYLTNHLPRVLSPNLDLQSSSHSPRSGTHLFQCCLKNELMLPRCGRYSIIL